MGITGWIEGDRLAAARQFFVKKAAPGCHDMIAVPGECMSQTNIADALKKRRQISITVIGRRTGKLITRPVWFASERNSIWLLPVYGSKTQWYRNLLKNRAVTIQAGRERLELRARLLKNTDAVREVVRRFRDKYTPEEIMRWYTGLDVAVQVTIGQN
jgi:deazaflavin-dependent oxidoreductase (nitroreductase family)